MRNQRRVMSEHAHDRPGFRRVLLKLGGEMFGGGKVGLDLMS